jgi:hypothetical protein
VAEYFSVVVVLTVVVEAFAVVVVVVGFELPSFAKVVVVEPPRRMCAASTPSVRGDGAHPAISAPTRSTPRAIASILGVLNGTPSGGTRCRCGVQQAGAARYGSVVLSAHGALELERPSTPPG